MYFFKRYSPKFVIPNVASEIMISSIRPSIDSIIAAHHALKNTRPLVQCLTNTVSVNFMANVLLSSGASPAMVDNPEEAADFIHVAHAAIVNLGTPTSALVDAIKLTLQEAQRINKPWVLDPIAAGSLSWRGQLAADFLAYHPAVIRGNASEIIGLAGLGQHQAGFDSSNEPAQAIDAAKHLLQYAQAVSASGEMDHLLGKVIEDRRQQEYLVKIKGGSYFFPLVTASGCSLGALVAAYCGVTDPFNAVVAAHAHFAVAGKRAHSKSQAPGTFQVEFLNALYLTQAEDFKNLLEFEIVRLDKI